MGSEGNDPGYSLGEEVANSITHGVDVKKPYVVEKIGVAIRDELKR